MLFYFCSRKFGAGHNGKILGRIHQIRYSEVIAREAQLFNKQRIISLYNNSELRMHHVFSLLIW